MDDRWQYLALMAACLIVTLPLEFVLRARVYRRPRRLLLALIPTVVIFTIWIVLNLGAFTFGDFDPFPTGFRLGVMPIEELVFFIVVPICGLLTYEAVGDVLRRTRKDTRA